MRINHNLPAMNTYRNLSGNNNKVSKSLEKLSSGLAINRAGDNAAGLAISEKMRAQIRGLDQGSANAQDGISMIQTAESALGETHDILQRMRELADQAANDTYADDDRSEIQKEINQLTSEINRIGNTTEFNTQKLLNGGKTEVTLKTITEGASQAKVQGQQISNGNIGGTQNKLMEGDKAAWSMTIAAVNVASAGVPLKHEFAVGNLEGEVVTVSQDPAGILATGEDYKISNNKLYVVDGAAASVRAKAMAEYGNKLSNGDYTFASSGADVSIKANYSDVEMNNQRVNIDGTNRDLTHGATNDDNKSGAVTQGSLAKWSAGITSAATEFSFAGNTVSVITLSAGDSVNLGGASAKVMDDGKLYVVDSAVEASVRAAALAESFNSNNALSDYTFTKNGTDITIEAKDRGHKTGIVSGSFTTIGSGAENQVAATSIENVVQDKEAIAAKWEAKLGTIPGDGSSYMFGFNGINIDIKKGSNSDFSGSQTSKFETTSMGNTLLVKDPADKEAVAKALADAFNTIKNGRSEISSKAAGFDFSSQGDKIIITDSLTNGDKNNGLKVTNGDAEKLVDVQREGRAQVTKQFEYTFENAFQRDGSTFKIGGQTFTAKNNPVSGNEFKTTTNVQDQLADIADLINKDAKLKANYAATVEGNKLIVKQKETGALKGGAEDASKMTVGGNDAIQGESVFKIDELKQVGGSYNINGISIRVTDDVSDSGLADGTAVLHSADKETQATNLTNAIMSNEKLLQQFSNATADGNTIRLTQSKGGSDLKTTEVGAKATEGDGYQAKLQIGANSGQSMTLKIGDMRAAALKVSGTEDGPRTVTSSTGQIASYVAVANVTNGTDDDSMEYALDVSTHDKATAAIDVINDAIKTVSAQRSQLGAYQNRLDHTINNLGTSSENLSSAESRIRDVDMAKEMMNYQKNNILSQAAQSMLAQANQLPQGVLQLLG